MGVGAGVGVAVGLGVGVGMGVPVGLGVGAGIGVLVGSGVGVGRCVDVGSSVFNSMVGDWSPTSGDSVVGRVENIPEGTVGDGAGSAAESPQARTASRAKAPTASFRKNRAILGRLLRWFTSRLLQPGHSEINCYEPERSTGKPPRSGINCLARNHPVDRFALPRRPVPASSRCPACSGFRRLRCVQSTACCP